MRYIEQSHATKSPRYPLPRLQVFGDHDMTEFVIRIVALDKDDKNDIHVRLDFCMDDVSTDCVVQQDFKSGQSFVVRLIRGRISTVGPHVLLFANIDELWVQVDKTNTMLQIVSTKTCEFAPNVTPEKIISSVQNRALLASITCSRCNIL